MGVRIPPVVPKNMYKKLNNCKYCKISFDSLNTSERANHSRWCEKNPKSKGYRNNSAPQLQTKQSIEKRTKGIKKAWSEGKYDHVDFSNYGWKHTEETKEHLRKKALSSNHRRLVRSIRPYTKKDGTVVMLDSSWEEILAKRLDDLNIEWTRPDSLPWIDKQGIKHNYFPDFFLPKHNLYLDPKNKIAVLAQKEKLNCLLTQYKNIVIIESVEGCKNFNIGP